MKTTSRLLNGVFVGATMGVLAMGKSVHAAPLFAQMIVPGQRIGQIHVGHDGKAQLSKLPQAQASDAGMSQNYQVWVSPTSRNTLFIHTVSNGALAVKPLSGVTITEINVTSPYFRTSSGVGAGSTLAQIRRAYPLARRNTFEGSKYMYDEPRKGLAFEFARAGNTARCIGVTVYIPGKQPDSGHPVSVNSVKNLLSQ